MNEFEPLFEECLNDSGASLKDLYCAVSNVAMEEIKPVWRQPVTGKRACYFSAEFLTGRMVYSNLYNMGRLEAFRAACAKNGIDPTLFEQVEDAALGNGGLGRLAACFLDSAATSGLRLYGYGIRYKYGLFQQSFEHGFQRETLDDWQRFGDPWSVRHEQERILVEFGDQQVWAVPYDMPVIGYGAKTVNTLRLWQAEPVHSFDFTSFNEMNLEAAYKEANAAEAIHSVLYPNDDTEAGKRLRIKQQYFFSSASLQSILREFRAVHEKDWARLPQYFAIQLNDTHPTVAIPELLRLLMQDEGLCFDDAFAIAQNTFAYTNHTIMAEALEKWNSNLFASVLPEVYPYIVMLNNHLRNTLAAKDIKNPEDYAILSGHQVHMARMAVYATHSTNGVAALHSKLLQKETLREWYALYPERFNNKTNGVTQRRWLGLCNPELAQFITSRIGNGWITNLDELEKLRPYADDVDSQTAFNAIKTGKKRDLTAYIAETLDVSLAADSIFDVQIKRLHEYKRQLLNAFSILDIYFSLKEGALPDFEPMTFLFGAKAAPGYRRAKGIIKFINEIAQLVENDPTVRDKMRVLFVPNYNVSWAERLIPAADLSEQISTAGTEASGTGNMKLMMNGAVTLGTYDGANIEIVEQAGEANNYIFGARVEDIRRAEKEYDPYALYTQNPRIRRVVNTLTDGTLDDGNTGMFSDLRHGLLKGETWHRADNYFLLLDFEPYVDAKLQAMREYKNRNAFAKKCLLNIAGAGKFSSDRTIRDYARDIWKL